MKRILIAIGVLILYVLLPFAGSASTIPAPCATQETLGSLESMGSTGCSVGLLTFSNWTGSNTSALVIPYVSENYIESGDANDNGFLLIPSGTLGTNVTSPYTDSYGWTISASGSVKSIFFASDLASGGMELHMFSLSSICLSDNQGDTTLCEPNGNGQISQESVPNWSSANMSLSISVQPSGTDINGNPVPTTLGAVAFFAPDPVSPTPEPSTFRLLLSGLLVAFPVWLGRRKPHGI